MTRLLHDVRVRVTAGALAGGAFFGLLVFAAGRDRGWQYRDEAAWIAGIVFAVVIFASLRSPRSQARWADAAETTEWVRDRTLPADLPLGEVLIRLATREDQIQRALWANGGLFVVCVLQLSLALPGSTLLLTALLAASAGFFAVGLGWAVQARVRQVPTIRALIHEGQQRFAGSTPSA